MLVTGCAGPPVNTPLTFDQLFASPDKFNGKTIALEAFYFHGFETIVLAERLELSGYAPGHLVPKGKLIWVEGGIPKDIYDQLYIQQQAGPTERIGKLRIKGQFVYGSQFGHAGGFDAQITPVATELLTWAPPQ